MAKRNQTKADVILAKRESEIVTIKLELADAKRRVETLEQKLEFANDVYADLKASLAPKPRTKPAPNVEKKSSRKSAQAKLTLNTVDGTDNATTVSKKQELCGICGNVADFQDHFHPSPDFHEFEGKKARITAA